MEIRKERICYSVGMVMYFVALLGSVIFPAITYYTYQQIARRGFLLSLLLTIIADFFLFAGKEYISRNTKHQMLIIYVIIATFFFPMFFRGLIYNPTRIHRSYNWIELAFVVIGLLFWGYLFVKSKVKLNIKKDTWWLFLVIVIAIVVSVEQLGIVIKGDSVEYYSKIIRICENFSFNPNDISLLKLSGHCSYAVSLFATIGENIFPYFGLGVRVENIIIWLLCIIYVWKILQKLNQGIPTAIQLFGVSCFAFTPLILGNIQEISVEIYGLFFFILFCYCNLSKKHILEMFFALCFVFAKEPNILILAGYYLGILIYQCSKMVSDKKQGIKVFDRDFLLSSLSIYVAATVFCIYFAVDVSWGVNDSFSQYEIVQAGTFAVNDVLIMSKLKQMYILNFSWLFVAIIWGGLVWGKAKKVKFIECDGAVLAIAFAYLFFLVSQLFYLTFVLPRYIMLHYFFLIVAMTGVLTKVLKDTRINRFAMVIGVGLMLCQNYYNIDPISGWAFEQLDTGNGNMIFENPLYVEYNNEFITYKDGEIPYIQPYGMTNKQFSYFDKLLEKALVQIEYSDADLIMLPHAFELYPDNFYWGNHLDLYYYDLENRCLVQLINEHVPESDNFINLKVSQISEECSLEEFDEYKNVYYFDFSFSDAIDMYVHNNYKTEAVAEMQYRGWILDVYRMEVE